MQPTARGPRPRLMRGVGRKVLIRMLRRRLLGISFSSVLRALLTIRSSIAQSPYPFVPTKFKVPEKLEASRFRLRMLTVHDVVRDYDAVMSSRSHLRNVFGRSTGWPADTMTLEQNLVDLGWHQGEFQRRRSFAYTVVDLPESRVLGCVYVNPTRKQGYDAAVFLWVRESELSGGLDAILFEAVQRWIKSDWPFRSVAYPGRQIAWEAWEAIPER